MWIGGAENRAKSMRLKWFRHVRGRGVSEVLGRAVGVKVPGCHSPGRSVKTWRQCVQEDLAVVGIGEAEAMGRNN